MATQGGPRAITTLRWNAGHGRLELLDQRALPARVEMLSFDSAAAVADAIARMVVRGAPAIGCAAAYGVALEARRLRDLPQAEFTRAMDQAFQALAQSRPTAINLVWALRRMHTVCTREASQTPYAAADALLTEAHAVLTEDVDTNRRLGAHGAALLPDPARVLTHCNAGALATAGHGTALGVIRSAAAAGTRISVIAGETRPVLQGARLTAWELQQDGIPVTLITDSMVGHLMRQRSIDAVIVGADRIAANGDVANKIGTYMIAVLAERHRIPFYVAAPLSSIDRELASGEHIPIEERAAEEVRGFAGSTWAPADVAVRNPAFDVTPAGLVTALITERGVLARPGTSGIAALFG